MAGKAGRFGIGWALAIALTAAAPAGALTVPFTEDFAANASGWVNASSAPLTWNAAGGPDGGSYVSSTLGSETGIGTIHFRANDALNASGDAFVGNWIANGVSVITAEVIHDAPVPLTFFFRFAGAGAMVGLAPPVAPNTWTTISAVIDPSALTPAGGTFAGVLGNVVNLQVGVSVPSIEYRLVPYTYGLDKVTIVPEPTTAGLLAVGLLALGCARRRS